MKRRNLKMAGARSGLRKTEAAFAAVEISEIVEQHKDCPVVKTIAMDTERMMTRAQEALQEHASHCEKGKKYEQDH